MYILVYNNYLHKAIIIKKTHFCFRDYYLFEQLFKEWRLFFSTLYVYIFYSTISIVLFEIVLDVIVWLNCTYHAKFFFFLLVVNRFLLFARAFPNFPSVIHSCLIDIIQNSVSSRHCTPRSLSRTRYIIQRVSKYLRQP